MESTFDKAVKAKEQKGEIKYLSVEDSRRIDRIVSDALGITIPGRGITPYKNI
jgi:hypothetical protein